ncbi:MAG: hypothetical protein V3T14_12235 [Myxococcota bacterium]
MRLLLTVGVALGVVFLAEGGWPEPERLLRSARERLVELTRLIEPRPQAAPVMVYDPEPAEPVVAPAPFVVGPDPEPAEPVVAPAPFVVEEPSPALSAHPPGAAPRAAEASPIRAVRLNADAAARIRGRLDRVMGLVAGAER